MRPRRRLPVARVANEVSAVPPVTGTLAVQEALRGRRRDAGGYAFEAVLLITLLLSLAVLVTLLGRVATEGVGVFVDRGVDFLRRPLSSLPSRAGVWQGLVGSMLLMLFVIVIAFPVGIAAAVYLEEYARDTRATRFISSNIRNLAGVPSVVYGLLGLAIFVQAARGFTGGSSVVSGGMTMAILVLPIVVITTSEALRAVPQSIREAGYGVGATKWEVIRSHVLPSAAPGIFTGTVLSLSRAFGETAPLIIVGAVTGFFTTGAAGFAAQLRGKFTSLPTIVYAWSRLPQPEFRSLTAAAILVLLAVLLLVNTTAIVLRNRYERRW